MELEYVKWVAALTLFCLTLFFCALPLCLLPKVRTDSENPNRNRYKRIISFISCCGGGVFLGTCLLHLFPDVQKQMNKVFQLLEMKEVFPVAEFLLAFGFLLILVIEQFALSLQQSESLPILVHQHAHDESPQNVHYVNYGSIHQDLESEVETSVHEDHSSHSRLRSAVLVLALSLHSVFEGFAIGLQSSSENVVRILIAVLIHKSIIAFTLGMNLTHSKLKKYVVYQCVALFSLTSPLGTVIGSVITDLGSGLSMAVTSGILQGIASGTFVYVTFFEVLPHEMNSMEDKMLKVLFLVLGFSAVTLLVLYVPD